MHICKADPRVASRFLAGLHCIVIASPLIAHRLAYHLIVSQSVFLGDEIRFAFSFLATVSSGNAALSAHLQTCRVP